MEIIQKGCVNMMEVCCEVHAYDGDNIQYDGDNIITDISLILDITLWR